MNLFNKIHVNLNASEKKPLAQHTENTDEPYRAAYTDSSSEEYDGMESEVKPPAPSVKRKFKVNQMKPKVDQEELVNKKAKTTAVEDSSDEELSCDDERDEIEKDDEEEEGIEEESEGEEEPDEEEDGEDEKEEEIKRSREDEQLTCKPDHKHNHKSDRTKKEAAVRHDKPTGSHPPSKPTRAQELTFYIGRLPGNFDKVKRDLEEYITDNGIRINKLEGHGEARFCHCILEDADDKEKMESLDNMRFRGKSLTVAQSTQFKGVVEVENKKICLLDVNPNFVTVDDIKKKTKASDVVIIPNQRLAYLTFHDAFDADKLMLSQYISVAGYKLRIDRPHYKSIHRDTGFKKVRVANPTELSCYRCGEAGHRSKSCPLPSNFRKGCPKPCFKCGKQGHIAQHCKTGGGSSRKS